jgi:hypothetical protein
VARFDQPIEPMTLGNADPTDFRFLAAILSFALRKIRETARWARRNADRRRDGMRRLTVAIAAALLMCAASAYARRKRSHGLDKLEARLNPPPAVDTLRDVRRQLAIIAERRRAMADWKPHGVAVAVVIAAARAAMAAADRANA